MVSSLEDVVISFDILLVISLSDVVLVGVVLFIDTELLSSVDEVTLLSLVSMALLEDSSLFGESVVLCGISLAEEHLTESETGRGGGGDKEYDLM